MSSSAQVLSSGQAPQEAYGGGKLAPIPLRRVLLLSIRRTNTASLSF